MRSRTDAGVSTFDVDAEAIVERARRLRSQPARTENLKRLSKRTFRRDAALTTLARRPERYGECEAQGLGVVRPCPFVSCAYHLALDVAENGNIKLNFPGALDDEGALDVRLMPATCALGVVKVFGEGLVLELVSKTLNVTRESVRQLERRALSTLRWACSAERENER